MAVSENPRKRAYANLTHVCVTKGRALDMRVKGRREEVKTERVSEEKKS